MSTYARPVWAEPVFHDAHGRAFTYGDRWGGESPPEDKYSVDSHPERFAPLHEVADALVTHLLGTYDVGTDDDLSCAADLLHPREDVVRAVRLTPTDPDAAPMTFVWTSYPGVVIHAGVLHDFPYPNCGCDACDETAGSQAEEMEYQVFAVAAGGYREAVRGRLSPWIDTALRAPDGSRSGTSSSRVSAALDRSRLTGGRRRLRSLPNGWQPWPVRASHLS
ncbi:hypothetical protein KZX45_09100 [Georgenia sp. EYE_87]|uniref:DUF6226 family protein n=1 Tax=Georgenia sp. EYE_87 TaxID=2853448 RepID=UPI002005B34A|nr:DUF6226 family protein [Georgenia sp. EYE_87]MCK6210695.1 hypothetical protein [Georgenia sp. EYE_87]